jgi:hypothetical protein
VVVVVVHSKHSSCYAPKKWFMNSDVPLFCVVLSDIWSRDGY